MHALKYYESEESDPVLTTNGRYRALENMIVGRPLREMFDHKVRELGVLSVRVEVVTDLVHVHGDPMFA